MPKARPKKFRDEVVAVARRREPGVLLKQIAAYFGISESCPLNWMHLAGVEDGRRPRRVDRQRRERPAVVGPEGL